MKKITIFLIAGLLCASSAFASELTPYVGLGFVVDWPGTDAKRPSFDPATTAIKDGGGGDMEFDAAFAAELKLGLKYWNVRGELEVAIRSASEDSFTLFSGDFALGMPGKVSATTNVKHYSYLANLFYDFEIPDSKWMPYLGAGAGIGQYKQKVEVKTDIMGTTTTETPIDHNKIAFEWQVAAGLVYNLNEDWGIDIGYCFNSATVNSEFVYAHELKVGLRYSF